MIICEIGRLQEPQLSGLFERSILRRLSGDLRKALTMDPRKRKVPWMNPMKFRKEMGFVMLMAPSCLKANLEKDGDLDFHLAFRSLRLRWFCATAPPDIARIVLGAPAALAGPRTHRDTWRDRILLYAACPSFTRITPFFRDRKGDKNTATVLVIKERSKSGVAAHVVPKKGFGGGFVF